MAAKFDGARASANMWVAQQNLAKWKGGRPHYQPKLRQQPPAPKPVAAPRVAPPAVEPTDAKE
jgi:hypothetical protein